MTTIINPQSSETLDLEATLQSLIKRYSFDALGNAPAQQCGRIAEIAAYLG